MDCPSTTGRRTAPRPAAAPRFSGGSSIAPAAAAPILPPSVISADPVIAEAPALLRNTSGAACSSGVWNRPSGIGYASQKPSTTLALRLGSIGVSVGPGIVQLIRIPRAPSSLHA